MQSFVLGCQSNLRLTQQIPCPSFSFDHGQSGLSSLTYVLHLDDLFPHPYIVKEVIECIERN